METENEKVKNSKKPMISVLIAVLVVIVILLAAVLIGMYQIKHLVNYEPIDKGDLDINDNLYNEIVDLANDGEHNAITQEEFNQIVNIVLFGVDARDSEFSGRTDTIMIASINPQYKSLKLISIPRDTYVNIPGHGMDKINHAYAFGKEQLSLKTINNNFGLNITEYMTIDFSGLIHVINDIGGIDLTISQDELRVLNQYLPASYKLTGKPNVPMTEYGDVHMNGEQALAHSRNRYVGSDFTRATRQRDVLQAIMDKMSQMSTTQQLELIKSFLKEVRTNIDVLGYTKYMPSLVGSYNEYKNNTISKQIPSTKYARGKMINKIYYFVPDSIETAKKDFQTTLYEK